MPVEVNAFKKLVKTWLSGITGMSAKVGTRVYCGRPMAVPTMPLISFGLVRRPSTAYPLAAWEGDLNVSVYSEKADELDDIEDLILDWLARNNVQTSLTNSSVLCVQCALTEIAEDESYELEEQSYVQIVRTMKFRYAIVSKET